MLVTITKVTAYGIHACDYCGAIVDVFFSYAVHENRRLMPTFIRICPAQRCAQLAMVTISLQYGDGSPPDIEHRVLPAGGPWGEG